MQRLADSVDAAVGTVYSYFPSKGALVAEVQCEAIDRLATSALLLRTDSDRLAADQGLTGADLAAFRLIAFGRWFCASAVTFPEEIRLMQSLMGEWRSHVPMDEVHRVLPAAMALLDLLRGWGVSEERLDRSNGLLDTLARDGRLAPPVPDADEPPAPTDGRHRIMTALVWMIAFFAGWFLWIAGEYHLHRFAMHHLNGRGLASREHLLHHAHPDRTDPFTRLLGYRGVVVVGTAIGGLLLLAAGSTIGVGVAVGWMLGYLFYEMMHWRAHARPPCGRYDLWMRRHHFHHFGHPMANHGVTTALWDRVYGTFERPDRIRVPRRLAMGWLIDRCGAVREEFRTDYVIAARPPARTDDAGSAGDAQVAEDERRAFANQAPAA